MEIVYDLVVVLHFLGLASLIGGALVQLSARTGRTVNLAMLHGALTQLVTGVALVGLGEAVDSLGKDVNQTKVGVKLAVVLVVTALCWIYRRRDILPDVLFFSIFGLSVANVVIAVMWQ
jgi:hypothetical protein